MSEVEKNTEKQQAEEKVKVDDEKWSKEKQRADQLEANYRKLATERDEIVSQLSTRDEKVALLEKKLEELADAKDVSVEELLDPDLVDAKTIKAVTKMAKQIKEQEKAIKQLTKLADDFKEKDKQSTAKSEKERIIEKILQPLDEEFGAKYRNAARKLADDLVDAGKHLQPKDAIDAMVFMRQCYKDVIREAEEKEKKEKKSTRTDSGSSSVSFDDTISKSGSRREILAEIRKKGMKLFGSAE